MPPVFTLKILPRLTAFALWLLVGLLLAWGVLQLRLGAGVPEGARTLPTAAVAAGDWQRMMGEPQKTTAVQAEAPAAPPLAQRYKLLGIVSGSRRVVLMSLDGKLPRTWRQGDALEEGYVVQRIGVRDMMAAKRDDASATFRLELPLLPPPATGVPGAGASLARPGGTPMVPPPPPSAFAPQAPPAGLGEAPQAMTADQMMQPPAQAGMGRMGQGGLLGAPRVSGAEVIPETGDPTSPSPASGRSVP